MTPRELTQKVLDRGNAWSKHLQSCDCQIYRDGRPCELTREGREYYSEQSDAAETLASLLNNSLDEIDRLTAELQEARLERAAAYGKPEGAPSPGWNWGFGRWAKDLPNGDKLVVEGGHWSVQYQWEDHMGYKRWSIRRTKTGETLMGWAASDRAAMREADASWNSMT